MKRRPEPLQLTADEWLLIYAAVSATAGRRPDIPGYRSILTKIGTYGRVARQRGVRPAVK